MYENIIVIPYRNRESQLNFFIKNIVPLIQEHLPKSKILVIEQNEGKLFNRGALLNVAFKEYKNKTIFFFTHDVDIIPTQEIIRSIYTKKTIDMYRIKSAHDNSLGGIIKVKHDIIFNIMDFQIIYGGGELKIEHYIIDVI